MVPVKLELQAMEAEQVGSLGPLGPILSWCHQENVKNKEFYEEQLAKVKAADRQERKEDREFLANFFKEQMAEQRKFYRECLELQASQGRASSGSFQPDVPVKVESSKGEERLGWRVEVDPKSLGWRALLHGYYRREGPAGRAGACASHLPGGLGFRGPLGVLYRAHRLRVEVAGLRPS